MDKKYRSLTAFALVVLVAVTWGAFGCKDRGLPQAKTHTGKIKDVDLVTKKATLEFVRKKDGTIVEIPGQATNDTKLTINGRLAELKEVRSGDEGTITGYYDDNLNTFIATVVEITRKDEPMSATQPSSNPASHPGNM